MNKDHNARQTGKEANFKGSKGTPFNKDNQPTPEAKSNGHKKKRALKELANALISGVGLEKAITTASSVGLEISEDIDVKTVLTLKQIEKAMNEGDTRAYEAAMNRMLGRPKDRSKVKTEITKNTQYIFIASIDEVPEEYRDQIVIQIKPDNIPEPYTSEKQIIEKYDLTE